MTDRELFKARFKALKLTIRDAGYHGHDDYDNLRLLAVQLDGFTHRVIYDFGHGTNIYSLTYSAYIICGDRRIDEALGLFFAGFSHLIYKHNAKEIIYVYPEHR